MKEYLEFEKPIAELEQKIEKLRPFAKSDPGKQHEINLLERKINQLQGDIFARLSAWQRTQLARHPARPTTGDYIAFLCSHFVELHGDRVFGDDHSIIGGTAVFHDIPVVVIGHQKGKTVKERVQRNFGMPHPEGYRKALRLMRLAQKFNHPILTLIDTPGAFPGIAAEERGQSEAIARNLFEMAQIPVPIIATVIGEGGSGGALALGVADRVLMLEHAIYSVISPEGCAAILWNSNAKAPEAAEAMKITSKDLLDLGVIDEIIPEPIGGAHRDPPRMAELLGQSLRRHLDRLRPQDPDALVRTRYEKFRRMGVFIEEP